MKIFDIITGNATVTDTIQATTFKGRCFFFVWFVVKNDKRNIFQSKPHPHAVYL